MSENKPEGHDFWNESALRRWYESKDWGVSMIEHPDYKKEQEKKNRDIRSILNRVIG